MSGNEAGSAKRHFHRIVIACPDANPMHANVTIDGERFRGICGLRLNLNTRELATLDVEMHADLFAELSADVRVSLIDGCKQIPIDRDARQGSAVCLGCGTASEIDGTICLKCG